MPKARYINICPVRTSARVRAQAGNSGAYRALSLLGSIGAAFSTPAFGSPLETPDLAAATVWEGRLSMSYQGTDREWILEGPVVDVAIPIARGAEASVKIGRAWAGGSQISSQEGWTDLSMAVKWEVVPVPSTGGFGLTIEPGVSIPTGSSGFGAEASRFSAPVTIGWQGARVGTRLSVGYDVPIGRGTDEVVAAAAITFAATSRLQLGLELVNRATDFRLDSSDTTANLGVEWAVDEDLFLMARIGTGLGVRDGDRPANFALFVQKNF